MRNRAFGLVGVVIVVAVLAVLAGGGFYFENLQNQAALLKEGTMASQQAEQVSQEIASTTAQQQIILNQISSANGQSDARGGSATSTANGEASAKSIGTNTVSVATASGATATSTDPLAGLGSDIYADGILPLGDYKYTTTVPKKGYVYLCNVAQGGEGAQGTPPWIGTSTWNSNEKTAVEGSVSWPNASITITTNGTTRTITTNDLPTIGTTGDFPIESTDPAYQYDMNPNSVEAQNLTFSLPENPTAAATPNCIYGEVGVMTNGVLLLDAFDAEYRDAAAHEMQDSCQGHPHEGGVYHYHSLSSCIPDATVTNIIGWAFDGYPITGPEISPGRYLTTNDLDECHGITSPVMLNGKMVTTYHYVMTQDFPYSVSCFHGKSYEPNPGGGMGSASANSGTGENNNSASANGTPPAPPQQAIDACDGLSSGASCTVGPTSGTCETIGGDFACKPNN